MTTKGQITKVASRDGVDARVIERDYVLAHVVALISAHDADHTLVFKGGTSLRLLTLASPTVHISGQSGSAIPSKRMRLGRVSRRPCRSTSRAMNGASRNM